MRAATFFRVLLGGFAKSISSMMKVANPIYDIVFKYLLEDERIASDAKIRHDMNVETNSSQSSRSATLTLC